MSKTCSNEYPGKLGEENVMLKVINQYTVKVKSNMASGVRIPVENYFKVFEKFGLDDIKGIRKRATEKTATVHDKTVKRIKAEMKKAYTGYLDVDKEFTKEAIQMKESAIG